MTGLTDLPDEVLLDIVASLEQQQPSPARTASPSPRSTGPSAPGQAGPWRCSCALSPNGPRGHADPHADARQGE